MPVKIFFHQVLAWFSSNGATHWVCVILLFPVFLHSVHDLTANYYDQTESAVHLYDLT